MLSLVGIGGAGCKIVESFYRRDLFSSLISRISFKEGYITGTAIDTSDRIKALNAMPLENRTLIGSSRAKGNGAGGDVALGRQIMSEESEIAMNAIRKATTEKPEAFFLIVGLGGGTGTGGFPIIAEKLKETYSVPVIGILILPARSEGTLYTKNASENFDGIVSSSNGVILLDNNIPTNRGEDILSSYKIINETILNFFNIIEIQELVKAVKGKISTIGFMRTKIEHMSIKDVLNKMFRDYVYFNAEGMERLYLIAYGDTASLYGQNFAKEWADKTYGAVFEYMPRDENSKYLNIGLIITGLKDIKKRFEIQAEERKTPSELEDLLGDIKPLQEE